MNDADALDVLRDLFALSVIDDTTDVECLGVERLRAAHGLMTEWLPRVAGLLNRIDEAELAEARARVAEIEARLNILPNPIRPESKPSERPLTDFEQTDAGMGIGGGRIELESVNGQSAGDFRDELAELREAGAAKRRRRNA